MDLSIHVDRILISIEVSILYFKRLSVKISTKFYDIFLSHKIVFILANCADPDEMPHNAAFHLGLHCLPKYLLSSIQNEKG